MFKFLLIVSSLFSSFIGSKLGFNSNRSLVLSTSVEMQNLKKGHPFWTWNSSYGDFDIHYEERGTGSKHVLLLHGFAANTYTWKALLEPLAEAGYHVWAIDLLGYGLSDKPENVPYGLDLFLSQISNFIKAKNISPTHIIGNSMGGGLALGTALAHPEIIKSLILIDAFGYPISLLPLEIGRTLGPVLKPFMGRFLINAILHQVMHDSNKITEEQIEAYTLPLQMPGGREALYATLQNFNEKQLLKQISEYPRLHLPMLIIWGKEDSWFKLHHYERFLKDFPQAKGVLIPNCGHIPQEECPQEVIKAIFTFLKSVN